MKSTDYLKYIVEEIHSTVFATVDSEGRPETCAIDMMDFDETGLYFLTARGKQFYRNLKGNENIAFTAMKGEDTLSCVAVSVRGRAKELGSELIPELFEKNPYMNKIYPNMASREALTVFKIYEGTGEWFDLRQLPIERADFAFGGAEAVECGYFVTDKCVLCGKCAEVCPQNCITLRSERAEISQEHCLRCGTCFEACPFGAIEARQP